MTDFEKLQNGSCIIGSAMTGSNGEEAEITKVTAGQIGGAFTYWLSQKVQKNPVMLNICVGADSRLNGEELKEGMLEAISLWGAIGHDAGLATTPAIFASTIMPYYEIDGAVMITAGSMPADMNGFRFFTADGELEADDIAEMLRLASRYTFIGGTYEDNNINLMQMYAAGLRQNVSQCLADVPGYLKGEHIIVDSGSGAAGFFAKDVLAAMGADVSGSFNSEPDGRFPAHEPNPADVRAMEELAAAVKTNSADLGILFNADASDMSAVNADGSSLEGSDLLECAKAEAAANYPGGADDAMIVAIHLIANNIRGKKDN